jgi:hypothetical protein
MSDEKQALRQPPAGFKRVAAVSNAPWFHFQEGNTLVGNYNGRYLLNTDPPRAYHQLELIEPCIVRAGKGTDAKIVEAKKGDIINLDEHYKIMPLKTIVTPECLAGAEYQVFAQVGKKIGTKGTNSMWDVDIHLKCIKGPTRQVRQLAPDNAVPSDDEGESNVPF